jgi:hypothetical protein
VTPDGPQSNRDAIRQHTLWGNLMAGGAGVEYYFGYEYAHNDLNAEDWRSRADKWTDIRHALAFFNEHLPFWDMAPDDALASGTDAYVLTQPGEVYAVYLPAGDATRLDLGDEAGSYRVRWYDPRAGGALQDGSVTEIQGPGAVALGLPPSEAGQDWAVLVTRQ